MTIPYSLLDIVPILEGVPVAQSYANLIDLAQRAEALGFTRYWMAEHHGHPGVASAAPVVLIAHVLAHTSRMRVGAGGVMLPNHAPLTVAEQFGTLASLHPDRVDLGVGRAPGTDPRTAQALRRHDAGQRDRFPEDVLALLHYFGPPPEGDDDPSARVRAFPGEGLGVPVYVLGSSLYGAELAAVLGLPFAFASHFAPEQLEPAMAVYRSAYRPSASHPTPYAIAAVGVIAADEARAARRLATTLQQHFLNLGRGRPRPLQPPVDDIAACASELELARLAPKLAGTVVGDPAQVRAGLAQFLARSRADELLITVLIHDHAARCRSMALAAEAIGAL